MNRMFWDFSPRYFDNIAIIDSDHNRAATYGELDSDCKRLEHYLFQNEKKLAFLFCENSYSCLLAYIGLLRSGHAIVMLDSKINNELKENLINLYSPDLIITTAEELFKGYKKRSIENGIKINIIEKKPSSIKIFKDLAILLSTSGTTGSPKLVRLSYKNIQANAESIAQYLQITENERPISSLPLNYSYGLSVINSHFLKGACIVLTKHSFVLRNFWKTFNQYKCTSFAGVPYSYHLLKKINFDKLELPTLKTMTQAGGALNEEMQKYFYDLTKSRGIKFFIMYGQTEATARISYVPFEHLRNKIGSIGIAIPNGKLKIFSGDKDITETGNEGELIYSGRNVMMGYAINRKSLIKGDELKGVLHTGDLARKDKDGFFFLTGRMKRYVKVFGFRINLDEIERMVENYTYCSAACFGNDGSINIIIQSNNSALPEIVQKRLHEIFHIHHSVLHIKAASSIPVTSSGKRDYLKIEEAFQDNE